MPRPRPRKLSTPFLRRVWIDDAAIEDRSAFPFSLPVFQEGFELEFDRAVTIIIGETEPSTTLAAIAALAGYDEIGKHRLPVEPSPAAVVGADRLARALRATWLPTVSHGWYFRAESFFVPPRRRDEIPHAGDATLPDHPARSRGEDFLQFVDERRRRQGVFILDTPETVLSPARQLDFLRLLRRMEASCQVIMATHSPLIMAFPGARLLRLSDRGVKSMTLEATDDFRLLLGFCTNPRQFVQTALQE